MTGLARLSLANRAVVALLSLVIIGAGLFSTGALKQELMPSLTLPQVTVLSVWQGAAPASVERDVTRPIEDAVKGVAGVTGVSSTSSANVSQISAEWDYGEDATEMENKIRAAVDAVPGLPTDVEPEIAAFDFDALPVVSLAVSSDLSPADLSERLRTVAVPRINALDGVGEATVSGEEVRQVVITTRQDDLDRLGVQPTELQQLLQVHGTQVPAGDLDTGSQRVNVQVGRTLGSVEDVEAIQLQGTDGPVRLGDVADVTNDPVDATAISRVNGEPAISLNVTKTTEANTVTVAHDLRALLPELEQEIGSGTRFQTVFDQSPFIEQSIHDLAVEGGLGLAMAIIVILVFLLSVRSTIITAISIPMSLLIAMVGLYVGGFSLNILTLGALTVAVGRVVDDSIVVIENIKRHLGLGEPFGTSTILGAVREVAGAVTASTITTVAVFLPIALVGGQVGELFRPFAVTVTVALLASLVVSLTIVPVLAMWFMRPSRKQQEAVAAADVSARAAHEERETPLQKGYLPVLRTALRHPVITLVVAAVVFVLTLGSTTLLKTDFLGEAGQNTLLVSQEMPSGTTLADTDAAAQKVEAVLAADPAVETYQTTVGGQGADVLTGAGGGSNTATISITLLPDSDGSVVADRLRAQLDPMTDIGETEVGLADGGAGGTSEMAVRVVATDDDAIASGAEQVEQALAGVPGLTDVGSDLAEQQTVFSVEVDQVRAAELGMNQATIGQAVAQALDGQPLGEVVLDDRTEQVVLRSRAPVEDKAALEALELPVTQRQTADVQERESDEVTEIQEENAEEQQAEAEAQLDEQAEALAEQRSELTDQLAELNDQLEEARNAPAPSAGLPGGAGGAPGAGLPGTGLPGAGLPGGALPEDLPSSLPSDLADASPEELQEAAEDVAESLQEAAEQAAEDQQRAVEQQQRAAEEAAAAQAAAAAEQQAA
ncbi:efflux RND transporter permease subunit, partial [Desertihabitans aurantiacus]|uniref:efflux RND transporter permease subunit n=1 Tax=Desertihabitans aurantiacus TaxID=2282477 RepID=UPI00130081E9